MKKHKKIGLSLNKKVVSQLKTNSITGGSSNLSAVPGVQCGGGGSAGCGPITQSPKCEAEMQ